MTEPQIIIVLLSVIGTAATAALGLLVKLVGDVHAIKTTVAVHAEKLETLTEKIEKHENVFITHKLKTAQ